MLWTDTDTFSVQYQMHDRNGVVFRAVRLPFDAVDVSGEPDTVRDDDSHKHEQQ